MKQEHAVVLTDARQFPSDGGWLFYYCRTCGANDHYVSAAVFNHGTWFDHEGYGAALDAFNVAHPHKQVTRSRWAQ